LKGLDILERNLLTYIGQIDPQEKERLASLNESLDGIRQSRANFILRLGPNIPVTTSSESSPSLLWPASNRATAAAASLPESEVPRAGNPPANDVASGTDPQHIELKRGAIAGAEPNQTIAASG
jgi:hypothetical protein